MHVLDHLQGPTLPGPAGATDVDERERPAASAPAPGQLAGLLGMVAAAEPTLVDVLRHLADRAAALVPAADGVLVAVRRRDGRREVTATADPARTVDALQLGLREGPLLDTSELGCAQVSPDLTVDHRWPRLAASIRTSEVRSALCVPICMDGEPLGTVSVYAAAREAFDARAGELLVRLAASAAPALVDVRVLDAVRRPALHLHLQAADRRAADEAVAVLCEEDGVGPEEAFAVLQLLGRTEHADLGAAARAVVDARTRTARAS